MGYEHRDDAVGGGGRRKGQTHTHTQCLQDTHGGWSLWQGSGAILTDVRVAPH